MELINKWALAQKRCKAKDFANQPDLFVIGYGYLMDAEVFSREVILRELKDRINNEIDSVIVKDTYTNGKNAGLRKVLKIIEDIEQGY